jgi:methyl acetate hydrolase
MSTTWSDNVDELLEGAVARGAIPGAVAVVAGPEGMRHEAVAGRLVADGPEVDSDTFFRFASMTKALGCVAALQLVEQGRLTLDQEVASVLPAFAQLRVLDGFDGDEPRLRAPARQATIRELMTHTAGHGYWFLNEDLVHYQDATGAPNVVSGLREGLETPLMSDPGSRWEYGINIDWVGQVVEAISGQDLAAYLDEHLLGPLGMTESTFAPTAEQRARLMPVHHRLPDGSLVAGDVDWATDPEFWAAGHGLYGPAREYARFMAAMLNGGELDGARILRPETVDLAFANHLGDIPFPERMTSAVPELTNDVDMPPVRQGWGLAFRLMLEDLPGMRRAGTADWAGLFNCYYWIDRASGVSAAFLTQVLPFFDAQVVDTALAVEQAVYAGLPEAAASTR